VAVEGEEVVEGRLRRYYNLSEIGHHALALEAHRWKANVAAANRVLAAHPAEGLA
jgi:DNA-binding PadR family transcriptional regulator